MTARPRTLLPLAASLLAVAGCGGDDTDVLVPAETSNPGTSGLSVNQACLEVLIAPIDLSSSLTIQISPDASVGDVELTGLNLTGDIIISGKAGLAARDGIVIGPSEPTCPSAEEVEYIFIAAPGLPAHDTGTFPNDQSPYAIAQQERTLRISAHPAMAASVTPLSTSRFDGVMLNGVPVMMRQDHCAGGMDCSAWQVNPLYEPSWFGIDSHNAHTLADGSYHYHGDPDALYDDSTPSGATIIGSAADGFPIFAPWINDGGVVRKVTSSYVLRTGDRPAPVFPYSSPSGPWTGEYLQDYEYVEGSGDLDECNGMTLEGVYGYFVTDDFPYLMHCFKGTPDPSFDITP